MKNTNWAQEAVALLLAVLIGVGAGGGIVFLLLLFTDRIALR